MAIETLTGRPEQHGPGATAVASQTVRAELPAFSRTRFRWFMAYVRWYARRHFHGVRLLRQSIPEADGRPVLVYTNHPGWWDPLMFLLVAGRVFPGRLNYGPIDSRALGRYRFFERIGFIGIDPHSLAGARRFLAMADASLQRTDTVFWVTSQGEFVDPRPRPVRIRPGVAHAVARLQTALVVPMAVEYPFWTERLPEALIAFGTPIDLGISSGRHAREWQGVLESALTATQDQLAAASMARRPEMFDSILEGHAGVGGIYDGLRKWSAWLRGRRFDPAHSSLQDVTHHNGS